MFKYKKQIAYIALILFIAMTIVIWLFALQPGSGSKKTSSRLYAFLFGLDYEKQQTTTDTEELNITSLSLTTPSALLIVGQSIPLSVKCQPENHTESITFSSSDEKIAKVSNKGIVTTYGKGTVTITAKGKNGNVSSFVTLTVYEQANALDNLDKDRFTLIMEDTFAQNDCVRPSILYDNQSISLDYTLISSNPSVIEINDTYVLTRANGTATLTVKVGNEVLFEKLITVTDQAKQQPIVNSLYVGDILVENEPITVYLGKNYDLNINLDNAELAVQSYVITRNNSITTPIYSNSSKNVQIYARQCGTTIVTLYSKTDLQTPLKAFTLNIIPPKLISTGLSGTDEYLVGREYNFSLLASDKNALEGYTYKVFKNGKLIASRPNGKYKFDEIGAYDIVFTSEYYPDDVYSFTIIVEDASAMQIIRKEFGHFGLFAVLGILALLAFGRLIEKFIPKTVICFVSGLIVAIISEVLQLPIFTQSRGASINDVFIDYVGFAFGLGVCFCALHLIFYIRSKRSTSAPKDK